MPEVLAEVVAILFLASILWMLSEVFAKAGFSRWWALLVPVPLVNLIWLLVFATIDWPIEKELSWRRLAGGQWDERDAARAHSYALALEKRGDWEAAISVYEDIASHGPNEQEAKYANNCIVRLRELQGLSGNAEQGAQR